VVEELWDDGWTHHIPRLMVLSNLATLLDVSPRELTDWFWAAYIDAYDWVVEPNVLGMGTFAVGDLMTTKPYVSGAAYLSKMGDYCDTCQFDPKVDCPIASWYWAFLDRHRDRLADNPRLKLPLASAAKRIPEARAHDAEVARRWMARGGGGQR
jgi:deoxyribodipyrimidine photolyase-related protein